MIHNEHRVGDTVVYSEDIDLTAGTITITDGGVVTTRALTPAEAATYAPEPPSPEQRLGALEPTVDDLVIAVLGG